MLEAKALAVNASLLVEAAALREGAPGPRAAAEAVRLAEIEGSVDFAGLHFRRTEIALLARGLTPPGRRLADCDAVADYAAAADLAATLGRTRPRRRLLRLDEILRLHALATRRSATERPGSWRDATAAPFASGVVPPPAWLVPRDMAAFTERFAGPLPASVPLVVWLADAHARFTRIHPFATANGRVVRLTLNLLLQRLGYPPLVLRPGDPARLRAALDSAGARELWPIAHVLGRSILETVRQLAFARSGSAEALISLADAAPENERAALYKAAQRGRLRTVRKGTAIFTSKTWLAEYRRSRAAAGRPPLGGRANDS